MFGDSRNTLLIRISKRLQHRQKANRLCRAALVDNSGNRSDTANSMTARQPALDNRSFLSAYNTCFQFTTRQWDNSDVCTVGILRFDYAAVFINIYILSVEVEECLVRVRVAVEWLQSVSDEKNAWFLKENDFSRVTREPLICPAKAHGVCPSRTVVIPVRMKSDIDRFGADILLTRQAALHLALTVHQDNVVGIRRKNIPAPLRCIVSIAACLDKKLFAVCEDNDAELVLMLVAVTKWSGLKS